jgi:hypothetical protein
MEKIVVILDKNTELKKPLFALSRWNSYRTMYGRDDDHLCSKFVVRQQTLLKQWRLVSVKVTLTTISRVIKHKKHSRMLQ